MKLLVHDDPDVSCILSQYTAHNCVFEFQVEPVQLVSTPRRIVTRAVVEIGPIGLVRVERLDQRLEEVLRSSEESVVSVDLKHLGNTQMAGSDSPEDIAA